MKKFVLAAFVAACSLLEVFASGLPQVTIGNVSAKQRYPWNGLVDIDYEITGETSGMKLKVVVEDIENGKTYYPTKFFSALPVSEGRHRITWNTMAEGVDCVSSHLEVVLYIEKSHSDAVDDVQFYTVDLSAGPTAEHYPVELVSAPPDTIWGDEYKTTKLVLRRLEAGSFARAVQEEVTTTNIVDGVEQEEKGYITRYYTFPVERPFYIGVYEVTQAQWDLVMSESANPAATSKKPKTNVSFEQIHGDSKEPGSTFLGKLCAKTGISAFDLPEADEWEYACRAGTTSMYNNGGDTEEDLKLLGRYKGNKDDGRGNGTTTADVGSYAPNALGLYDMHGNVAEWTVTESKKPGYNLICGGSHEGNASDCRSSSRPHSDRSFGWAKNGFRIICGVGL